MGWRSKGDRENECRDSGPIDFAAEAGLCSRPRTHDASVSRQKEFATWKRSYPMDKPRHSAVSPVLVSLVLVAAQVAGSCTSAPPPVHAMRDSQANFSAFRTF